MIENLLCFATLFLACPDTFWAPKIPPSAISFDESTAYTRVNLFINLQEKRTAMLIGVLPWAEPGYYMQISNMLKPCDYIIYNAWDENYSEINEEDEEDNEKLLKLFVVDPVIPAKIRINLGLWEERYFFNHYQNKWIAVENLRRNNNNKESDGLASFENELKKRVSALPYPVKISFAIRAREFRQKIKDESLTKEDVINWLRFSYYDHKKDLKPIRDFITEERNETIFKIFDNLAILTKPKTICSISWWYNLANQQKFLKNGGYEYASGESKALRAIVIRPLRVKY